MKARPSYLVINHVPVGPAGPSGARQIGDLWVSDIRAMIAAGLETGFDVTFVLPVTDRTTEQSGNLSSDVTAPNSGAPESARLMSLNR